jgi:hypothetical protein
MSTTESEMEITEEVEEILRDAWRTARVNLLLPSATEIFAFVRNYSDETETLTDDQLMEFGKEIRDGSPTTAAQGGRMAAGVRQVVAASCRSCGKSWIARRRTVRRVRLGCSCLSRAARAGAWLDSASALAACRAAGPWPWLPSFLPGGAS